MFVSSLYRRCADELGALSGIELSIFMPESWRMNGTLLALDPPRVESPYAMLTGTVGWKGYENRGFYTSGLVRAFRQSKPEVLYLMEEPFSLFTLQVLSLRKLLAPNIPVVFFTWNNLSLKKFDYRPSVLYRTIAAWALPQFDRAVTANTDAIEVLRSSGFHRPARTIGYGVDTEAFSRSNPTRALELRRQLNLGADDRVIGFIGRIKLMKGIDLLVDAFAELVTKGEKKVKLLIVGTGEYEQELQGLIERNGIAEDVRRVPNVPQAEVPDYMSLMDVMVLPSRREGMWTEQFGRVLVEAMAARTIVVGSTSGAIPEVIGDAGFIFQENNAADLAQTLNRALQMNPLERERLLKQAHQRATNEFSWRTFAERSREELFSAVCDRKEGRS
jgi:glycosyltransferase involved in cell wall biosynthesis